MTASRTPSEIWSATLSGWPSVTDSEVNRNSFSDSWVMDLREALRRRGLGGSRGRLATPSGVGLASGGLAPLLALDEVDDQRHPVQPVALAQPVLDEVRVVTGQARARVDLDREAGRGLADLGHVEQLEAVALTGGGLADGLQLGEEAVEV